MRRPHIGRKGFEQLYALRNDIALVEMQHAATEDEADDFFRPQGARPAGLGDGPRVGATVPASRPAPFGS